MMRQSFTVHVDCDDAAHGQRVAAAMHAEARHAADEVAIEMHNLCPTATTAFEITPLSAPIDTDMGAPPWNRGLDPLLWTPTPGAPEVGADWWVTVCAACLTAICWHGEMMCDQAREAGTCEMRARALMRLEREHSKHALVAAFVAKHFGGPNGNFVVGHGMEKTLGTVTAKDHHALAAASLVKFYGRSDAQGVDGPLRTVTSAARFAEVRAFLTKFYGTSTGSPAQLPLPTVTTGGGHGGGHLGLVMVHGEPYAIVDIGMRMLQPHELFAAQGFPPDYDITPTFNGKPLTKTDQIALAGNSVCPQVAEALVAANAREREGLAA